MICNTPKDLLAALSYYMDLNDLQRKTISVELKKSPQSISQIFQIGNPQLNTFFDILQAIDLSLDVNFVKKSNDE